MSSLSWGLGFSGKDLSGKPCSGGQQGYGPYDYTNQGNHRRRLPIVEEFHFTPAVEGLRHGQSSLLLHDIDYTIRAFPNHHRALFALIRFVTEPGHPKEGVGDLRSQPECYLQRALRFKPDDGKVMLLYGLYLHRLGKLAEAEHQYRAAVKQMPRSSEAHYNLGLLLTDMERYQEAVPEARKAYQLGYPLSGLRRRLAEAGHPLDK